jgi:hypothetical protein
MIDSEKPLDGIDTHILAHSDTIAQESTVATAVTMIHSDTDAGGATFISADNMGNAETMILLLIVQPVLQ